MKFDMDSIEPYYDSPLSLVTQSIMENIGKQFDDMTYQAIQKVGIDVDRDKLLEALQQDKKRYEEAYCRGANEGYKRRDDELIRCRDCQYFITVGNPKIMYDFKLKNNTKGEWWYCWDAERLEEDEDE